MPQKVFTYKPIGFRVTYALAAVFFFLSAMWFALAPFLIEVKEGSHLILYCLSAFFFLLTWADFRILIRIIGYENLAKGKRVVLNPYSRLVRIEHKGRSVEFYPKDIRMVHIYQSTTSHVASSYFSYMIIELKDGIRILITKNTAREYDLIAGLYKARRNRIKKWGHQVPKGNEFWL